VDPQPVFYYDLGSPQCYIVGEAIMSTLPVVPEWEPVLASRVASSEPQSGPDHSGSEPQLGPDHSEVERLADALGLQPLRWPPNWPPDTTRAMLAATYAKNIGRGVAFSLAAFRQTFAGGRDIGDETTVLIAGAACEMHPTALTRGIELKSTSHALQTANIRAQAAGVTTLPAIQVGDSVYEGQRALLEAAEALRTQQP
jgi:2-hydroxychromene-2-carboxylate isomerase